MTRGLESIQPSQIYDAQTIGMTMWELTEHLYSSLALCYRKSVMLEKGGPHFQCAAIRIQLTLNPISPSRYAYPIRLSSAAAQTIASALRGIKVPSAIISSVRYLNGMGGDINRLSTMGKTFKTSWTAPGLTKAFRVIFWKSSRTSSESHNAQ